jgi:hypothetical protein
VAHILLVKGKPVRKYVVESVAALAGEHALTPKQVAEREGVSRWAIYKRRSRLEGLLGREVQRGNETRGRKRRPRDCRPVPPSDVRLMPIIGPSAN